MGVQKHLILLSGCNGRLITYLLLILSLLIGLQTASGQPLADIDIGIVTYGPGDQMMTRFGHTSVVLVGTDGEKEFFDLAASRNDERHFLPWYLTPHPLIYTTTTKNRTYALSQSFIDDRSVDIRLLDLSASQKRHFAQLLAHALDENNALFEFGLYTQNCTTRVREILDTVLSGQLQAQFSHRPEQMSYRDHTRRSFQYNWLLRITSDLVSGRLADSTKNYWDEAYLPARLAILLDQAQITDQFGRSKALVNNHYPLLAGQLNNPVADQPTFIGHWFWLCGLILAVFLYFGVTNQDIKVMQWSVFSYLVAIGLVGALLCYLWFVGGEAVTAWNENILLFSPFALMLAFPQASGIRRFLSLCMLLSILSALALKLLPGSQNNWDWIGLSLPVDSILLWHLCLADKPKPVIRMPKHVFTRFSGSPL